VKCNDSCPVTTGQPYGGYQSFHLSGGQGFSSWEIALTVVAVTIMVVTVVAFVRRLRRI
jgi:hypothetical protein